jgi:hypothetical protein
MANVVGESSNPIIAAVQGSQTWAGASGALGTSPAKGVSGQSNGLFDGEGRVTGNLLIDGDVQLIGADLAEQLGGAGLRAAARGGAVWPGSHDRVRVTGDRRVNGILSGGDGYQPGVAMDRQRESGGRWVLALSGKVRYKVDADCWPVEGGDFTPSASPDHIVRAMDRVRARGVIIGISHARMLSRRGRIPALVALR